MSDLISKKALLEALSKIEAKSWNNRGMTRASQGVPYLNGYAVYDPINSSPAVSGDAVGIFIGEFHGDVNGRQYFTCKAIGALPKVGAELYLAPPQPQSVKDALEKAADIVTVMLGHTEVTHDVAETIRKLIEDK